MYILSTTRVVALRMKKVAFLKVDEVAYLKITVVCFGVCNERL